MSAVLSDEQVEWLTELLAECEDSARLTNWEEEFVGGIRDRFLLYRERLQVSPRQMEVLQRVEEKIYQ